MTPALCSYNSLPLGVSGPATCSWLAMMAKVKGFCRCPEDPESVDSEFLKAETVWAGSHQVQAFQQGWGPSWLRAFLLAGWSEQLYGGRPVRNPSGF